MNKPIDYYLGLPYTIQMIPDEGGWFASVKELPGCMSDGDTPDHAMAMVRDAMRAWIETCLEDGEPVPEPRELEAFSGKLLVRVPASLHRSLTEDAANEGVSLNQHINVVLARSAGVPVMPPSPPGRGSEGGQVRNRRIGPGRGRRRTPGESPSLRP